MTNHTPQPFEDLTTAATQERLSISEREAMQEALRAYRTFHPVSERDARPLAPVRWFVTRSAAAVALLLLLVVVPIQAQRALPGEPLYLIKVDVVEPFVGSFYASEYDQIRYTTTLMTRRLEEAHRLQQMNEYTEASAAVVAEEVLQRSAEITTLFVPEDGEDQVASSSLRALSDAMSVLRTHQYVEDRTFGNRSRSDIDTAAETLQSTLAEQTKAFTEQRNEDDITEYIAATLADIADTVTREAGSVEDVTPELADYLADIPEAIASDSYNEAIQYAHEADQLVDTEVALDDLEEADVDQMDSSNSDEQNQEVQITE
jgi:hypothetical protein